MNPVLIYQSEVKLDYNNKFTINFIDGDIINRVQFLRKNQYYIAKLNCNITKSNNKEVEINHSKKILVDDLSIISKELLDKGSDVKNEINYMSSFLPENFDLPNLAPQTYKLKLDPIDIQLNSYSYQFYDVKDKRIKFAKIYSPFSHFKSGFIFLNEKDQNKKIKIRLVDNAKIEYNFIYPEEEKIKIQTNLYRDMSTKYIKVRINRETLAWQITNPDLIWEAEKYSRSVKKFNTDEFMEKMYFKNHYGLAEGRKYTVIQNSAFGNYTNNSDIPFVQQKNSVIIRKNKPFFVPGSVDRNRHKFNAFSILDLCTYLGNLILTDDDKKQLNNLLPNFSFKSLAEYSLKRPTNMVTDWTSNDLLYLSKSLKTAHNEDEMFDLRKKFLTFTCDNKKYKDYLDTGEGVFFKNFSKDLPATLDECEKLFDNDVLVTKALVKKIGPLREIGLYEQLNLILYDNCNLIEETYIQRFNTQTQLYGFISIPFFHTKENHLITLQNLLAFRVKNNIQKEKIVFELSFLEDQNAIFTDDEKIHNLSIVCVENKIENNIEALQAFDKYQKLNPIEIKITDNNVFHELTYKNYQNTKYRFIPNSILFSSSVQEDTEVIFLIVTGLNDARYIFINGKVYKSIGCVYTSAIEGWNSLKKKTSNWVLCKLSNSKYPFGTKHLGFEFDTTRLNSLIDFTLYLLDQNGNEISFSSDEKKTPTLNFSIQIIS